MTEGDSPGATDLVRSFSSRMSRSVPLDELVLQAVEGLRTSMRLRSAEVWLLSTTTRCARGSGSRRSTGRPIPLGGMDPVTIVQAGLSGHGWLQVWLPQVLDRRERSYVRLAPMANAGELLGVVIVDRPVEDRPFTPEEERVLVELARQLGVMVHNAQLDSALQASLDEVRRQAAELQASRGRIVAATDQARRRIERDLHDGAQQHIVALAVRVKLAEQLLERDPVKARAALEEIAEAIDDALQELRDLAHGIYPPLLVDKGLPAALGSAARRAVLPVTVRAEDLGRYPAEAEATVYFCVLEALQNAGKYAGESATVRGGRSGGGEEPRLRRDATTVPASTSGAGSHGAPGSRTCSTGWVRSAARCVWRARPARGPRSGARCRFPPPGSVSPRCRRRFP